jgi:hypothetical protein
VLKTPSFASLPHCNFALKSDVLGKVGGGSPFVRIAASLAGPSAGMSPFFANFAVK